MQTQLPLPSLGPSTPCDGCIHKPNCNAHRVLEHAIYAKPGFLRPTDPAAFLGQQSRRIYELLAEIARAWIATTENSATELSRGQNLACLFDLMLSALYANRIERQGSTFGKPAFVHVGEDGMGLGFFPYLWMCPQCIANGSAAREAYLPGSSLRGNRRYADSPMLSRPSGRMIGDLGALAIRAILETLTSDNVHFSAGGGHRGEFDLVVATEHLLVLCEIKASPLVCFPLVCTNPVSQGTHAVHHEWMDGVTTADDWYVFVGANGPAYLQIAPPDDPCWPLPSFTELASDATAVQTLVRAWQDHLIGYRAFNDEPSRTRWLRFGCGNIETRNAETGKPVQLRVDNTKSLPGIDRTDDIKKGTAQLLLFGRLKRGCQVNAVKTVLLGNLFAETHHEHYLRPLAKLQLAWPGYDPLYLYDAIIAFSRNIINDPQLESLFGLPDEPYPSDDLAAEALVEESRSDE